MPDASSKIISYIRTYTPIWVGLGLAYLANRWGIVVDEETSVALGLGLAGLLQTIYYWVARQLEARFPKFGWLLGNPAQPTYPTAPGAPAVPAVAEPDPYLVMEEFDRIVGVGGTPMVPLADALAVRDAAAEAAATEAYRQIDIGGGE